MATANFTRLSSCSGLHSAGMKALLFSTFLLLAGCGGSVKPTPAVVFVGDSIFGRLASSASFNQSGYVNSGVFGQRTDEVLARFPNILSGKNVCHGFIPADGSVSPFPYQCASLSEPPATVVIFAGWNNFFQGNKGDAIADLTEMVRLAHVRGTKVVICTLYAYDPAHPAPWMVPTGNAPVTFYDGWREPLNDGIKAMQNLPGVSVVDLDSVFASESGYTLDGVHPTDDGNIQLLNGIAQTLNSPTQK